MADLKDEIARLKAEHGYKAVEDEIKKARPEAKRGRPLDDDAQELRSVAWQDAFSWAFGHDIRGDLSDNAVAKMHASFEPGHSEEATRDRIRHKLAGTRRLERVLRLMANPDNSRRLTKQLLFCKDREARAVQLSERAKKELDDLQK